MITTKALKLIDHIQNLVDQIAEHDYKNHIQIHRCIDMYYYLQKMEELMTIHNSPIKHRLTTEQVIDHYQTVYDRWRNDARWLNKHLLFNAPCEKFYMNVDKNILLRP